MNDRPGPIETPRLHLHLISVEMLIALFEDPESVQFAPSVPYSNPYRVLVDDSGPLRWRVPQVKVNPELNKWFVRFVVLRETSEVVGSISFHGSPDENGMLEIGLGIDENFRNQGIATEALAGMWWWASKQPGVKVLRYTVSPKNEPSVHVINKFGFALVGQQIDEEDGPEDIYEMSALDFLARTNVPVVIGK